MVFCGSWRCLSTFLFHANFVRMRMRTTSLVGRWLDSHEVVNPSPGEVGVFLGLQFVKGGALAGGSPSGSERSSQSLEQPP